MTRLAATLVLLAATLVAQLAVAFIQPTIELSTPQVAALQLQQQQQLQLQLQQQQHQQQQQQLQLQLDKKQRPARLPSINFYVNQHENYKLLGINSSIYYVSNGDINEYALKFAVPLGYNQSDMIFNWQNLGATNVNYSISLVITNIQAVDAPLINITRTGLIPRHEQVFKITLPCSGQESAEADVQVLINIFEQQQQQVAPTTSTTTTTTTTTSTTSSTTTTTATDNKQQVNATQQNNNADSQQQEGVAHLLTIKRKKICLRAPVVVSGLSRPSAPRPLPMHLPAHAQAPNNQQQQQYSAASSDNLQQMNADNVDDGGVDELNAADSALLSRQQQQFVASQQQQQQQRNKLCLNGQCKATRVSQPTIRQPPTRLSIQTTDNDNSMQAPSIENNELAARLLAEANERLNKQQSQQRFQQQQQQQQQQQASSNAADSFLNNILRASGADYREHSATTTQQQSNLNAAATQTTSLTLAIVLALASMLVLVILALFGNLCFVTKTASSTSATAATTATTTTRTSDFENALDRLGTLSTILFKRAPQNKKCKPPPPTFTSNNVISSFRANSKSGVPSALSLHRHHGNTNNPATLINSSQPLKAGSFFYKTANNNSSNNNSDLQYYATSTAGNAYHANTIHHHQHPPTGDLLGSGFLPSYFNHHQSQHLQNHAFEQQQQQHKQSLPSSNSSSSGSSSNYPINQPSQLLNGNKTTRLVWTNGNGSTTQDGYSIDACYMPMSHQSVRSDSASAYQTIY